MTGLRFEVQKGKTRVRTGFFSQALLLPWKSGLDYAVGALVHVSGLAEEDLRIKKLNSCNFMCMKAHTSTRENQPQLGQIYEPIQRAKRMDIQQQLIQVGVPVCLIDLIFSYTCDENAFWTPLCHTPSCPNPAFAQDLCKWCDFQFRKKDSKINRPVDNAEHSVQMVRR